MKIQLGLWERLFCEKMVKLKLTQSFQYLLTRNWSSKLIVVGIHKFMNKRLFGNAWWTDKDQGFATVWGHFFYRFIKQELSFVKVQVFSHHIAIFALFFPALYKKRKKNTLVLTSIFFLLHKAVRVEKNISFSTQINNNIKCQVP